MKTKIIASIAVVGTVAAVAALVGMNVGSVSKSGARMLQSNLISE